MNRTGIVLAVAVCALLACADWAQGQRSRRSYSRPPTLSPYLDLLRVNTGVLPNYQAFVKPRIQQRKFNEQERRSLQTLEKRVRQFSSEAVPATGVASGFRNNDLYFRNNSSFFQTHRTRP